MFMIVCLWMFVDVYGCLWSSILILRILVVAIDFRYQSRLPWLMYIPQSGSVIQVLTVAHMLPSFFFSFCKYIVALVDFLIVHGQCDPSLWPKWAGKKNAGTDKSEKQWEHVFWTSGIHSSEQIKLQKSNNQDVGASSCNVRITG